MRAVAIRIDVAHWHGLSRPSVVSCSFLPNSCVIAPWLRGERRATFARAGNEVEGPAAYALRRKHFVVSAVPAAGDNYGDVTVKAMAMAMKRVPRVEV
jgi:hypothetical protein